VAVLEYIGPPVLYGINFTAAKYRAAKIKYFFCLFSQSVNQSVDPSICPCICQLFSLVMHSRTRKCKCCFLSACRIILMVVVKSTVSVASLLERGTIYPLSWSCCAGGRKFESWLMGYSRGNFPSNQATGKVFSTEIYHLFLNPKFI